MNLWKQYKQAVYYLSRNIYAIKWRTNTKTRAGNLDD
jgi:hypothetical protein